MSTGSLPSARQSWPSQLSVARIWISIGGTVHGPGAPLVFLHAVIGDGDLDWQAHLPHLTACTPATCRACGAGGLSGDHPDLSSSRLIDDFLTYAESIGEATGLVGLAAGGGLALAVAGAQSDAVDAEAVVEPLLPNLLHEHERGGLGDTLARRSPAGGAAPL